MATKKAVKQEKVYKSRVLETYYKEESAETATDDKAE